MQKVKILDKDGILVNEWPVDNEHIVRAAQLEVELHNRDNPDDLWAVEVVEE
jgi:tRNA A37 threonylcarbamoyladenosine biosynthesis protein TsaE